MEKRQDRRSHDSLYEVWKTCVDFFRNYKSWTNAQFIIVLLLAVALSMGLNLLVRTVQGNKVTSSNSQTTTSSQSKENQSDETTARIMANGDLLYHIPIYRTALKEDGSYDFHENFEYVKPWLKQADLVLGDFEGTVNKDHYLAGYPLFNAPGEVMDAIKDAGYQVLDLAHNHILDSQIEGVVSTAQAIEKAGMTPIGVYTHESRDQAPLVIKEVNGIKVAVIGSGPAGLSFAGDMAKRGFEVYVFEALHEIGGVLKYGIPEFRLPNKIVDVEIDNLRRIGVHFQTDTIVGKTISIEDLKEKGFKGIFVGSGAGLPNFMGIPGENAINILSSNEYLTRVNLMDAANPETDTPIIMGKKVLVIGGGNTAMDSCRTAKRLGADVTLVYRRSEAEMPARLEEVKHAKEEGINFLTLHNPQEYKADEKGRVCAAVLDVMKLGEPDASGRCRPELTGETVTVECDQVIVAVGVSPNPLVPKSVKGLELGRKDTIVVNEQMQSSQPEIFAGGDIVRGGATVILAMGDGRRAAANMAEQLLAEK